MYQTVRKVYIQGIINGTMNKSNNIYVEIDFPVRTRIWQYEDYFKRRLEIQNPNRDFSKLEFKAFDDNLWDDEICGIYIKCLDEDKGRSHSKQRKEYISYRNAKNGDTFD